MSKKPTVLMILDGYGLNEKEQANAVFEAKTPVMDILMAVVSTLESIEVHGSENMSRLLGCINALTEIINKSNDKDGEEVNNG